MTQAGRSVTFHGAIFTATKSNILGTTFVSDEHYWHRTTLKQLRMTDGAFNALVSAFDMKEGGIGYASLRGATTDFASLTTIIAVPEPSTHALTVTALAGMGLMVRRRRSR